jgi:putative membrane protein
MVSGLLVVLVIALLPSIDSELETPIASVLTLAVVYALLDAFVRPFLNVLLMPFVVQSYGLALVAVDILIFALLLRFSRGFLELLGSTIVVDSLWPILIGGLVLGLLKLGAEAVLGLTPPVEVEAGPDRASAR